MFSSCVIIEHLEAILNVKRVDSWLPNESAGKEKEQKRKRESERFRAIGMFAFDICPNQWTSIFDIYSTFLPLSLSYFLVALFLGNVFTSVSLATLNKNCQVSCSHVNSMRTEKRASYSCMKFSIWWKSMSRCFSFLAFFSCVHCVIAHFSD